MLKILDGSAKEWTGVTRSMGDLEGLLMEMQEGLAFTSKRQVRA